MQFSWFDRLTTSFRGVGTDELLAGFSYVGGKWTPAIYQQDALMSVTGISSHDGSPVWSADYTAFGDRLIGATGKSGNNLQYTGRENDGTGLYYYRARYYDPSIGRFISEDPLGFQAGINFYAYVNNNPVNGNDPTGQDAVVDPWLWANIGVGATSFAHNVYSGNWGWAAVDAAGLAYDAAAGVFPFLPAGASAGLQALQAGNTIAHSIQIGQDVATTARIANDAALAASTVGRPAAIGTAVHNEVGTALNEGDMLSSSANNFFKGANGASGRQPDLSWNNSSGGLSGVWADLTTPQQWASHVDLYGNSLGMGTGIPLLYERGAGLVNTSPISPFMGSAAAGTQMLFGDSSAQAAGGFMIYPNHPNTNQVQRVYAK